ncbi:hypothetical protein HDU77_005482 [Chytriomyces hyalinus]|nr:hypothetical protein HDU77_005482 [Chytriomyces hyalinus]
MSFLSMLGTPRVGSLDVSLDFSRGVYEEGDQIANYTLIKEIGYGSFSRVFLAHDSISNQNFAIKILRKPDSLSPIQSPMYSLQNSMDSLSMQGRINIPNYQPHENSNYQTHASSEKAPSNSQPSPFQSPHGPTSIYSKDQNEAVDNARQLMDKETRIWASLDHPNILSMYEVMELDDAVCIVTEYAAGGSLLDYLTKRGRTAEHIARPMFLQLAEAVNYMHKTVGIVHRDLKCENVLVLEDWKNGVPQNAAAQNKLCGEWIPTLKIIDFGLSEFIGDDQNLDCISPTSPASLTRTLSSSSFGVGSLHYCAPEDLREAAGAKNGESSDVWALGCILYAILTGSLPFNDGFLPRLQQTILNGTYDASRLASCGVSDGAQDLLKGIFCVDVSQRFTIGDVLASKWLQDSGEVEVEG